MARPFRLHQNGADGTGSHSFVINHPSEATGCGISKDGRRSAKSFVRGRVAYKVLLV